MADSPVEAALDQFTHPAVDVPTPDEGTPAPDPSQASAAPSATAHPAADVPIPGEAPAKVSASVTRKGMTEQGLATTARLGTLADQLANQDLATFAPENAAEAAQAERIHQEHLTAIGLEGEANAKKAAAEQTYWKQSQELQRAAADAQQRAYADSKIVRERYLGAYEQQLAAVRQLAASSGDPMADLTRGQMLGLVGAQFAQGFLAARGINIDVSGQVDRWVSREIAKHQQKIQNARTSAEDTMHLYEIARQTSADDSEARDKYTGMVLESLKSAYSSQAAGFNSDLARAAASQKIAEADAKLLEVKSSLANRAQQLYLKTHEMRITQAHYKAQDAAEMMRAQATLEAERNKAKGAAGSTQYFLDPTTGKRIGKVMKGSVNADERAKTMSQAQAGYANVANLGRQLLEQRDRAVEEVRQSLAKYGPMKAQELASQARRDYDQSVSQLAIAVTKANNGKNSSDQEAQRIRDLIPFESPYEKGTNSQQVINFLESMRKDYAETARANLDKLDPTEEGLDQGFAVDPYFTQLYNASTKGKEPVGSYVADQVQAVVQKDSGDKSGKASPLFQDYATARPGSALSAGEQLSQQIGATSKGDLTANERITAIDHLALAVVKPDELGTHGNMFTGEPEESPQERQKQAMGALERLAKGEEAGETDDAKKYAQYVLERIKRDPTGVAESLETDEEFMTRAMRGR
jgi:hypothetical protein